MKEQKRKEKLYGQKKIENILRNVPQNARGGSDTALKVLNISLSKSVILPILLFNFLYR